MWCRCVEIFLWWSLQFDDGLVETAAESSVVGSGETSADSFVEVFSFQSFESDISLPGTRMETVEKMRSFVALFRSLGV